MNPPNPAHTPNRNIRVPDDEWEAFKAATEAEGETASAVARRLFRQYVREHAPELDAARRRRARRQSGTGK